MSKLALPDEKLIIPERITEEWIKQYAEDRWLCLGDTSKYELTNPFSLRTQRDIENPHEFILDLMRRPENFGWTVKVLLGKTLAPFQVAILQELWSRPFPMLIASRGGGKSFIMSVYCMLRLLFNQGSKIVVCGAAFRQAKVIFDYCQNMWENAPIYQDIVGDPKKNGPRRDVDRCFMTVGESLLVSLPMGDGCLAGDTMVTYGDRFGSIADNAKDEINKTDEITVWGNGKFRATDEAYKNGVAKTKIVTTKRGYRFEGTLNHKMKVCRNGKVDWVRSDEMRVGDKILIDRSERWHSAPNKATPEEGYALGAMIGDGCYTNVYRLGFATTEPEHFIPRLENGIGVNFKQGDAAHWYSDGKNEITAWKNRWGLRIARCHEKELPTELLKASKDTVAACISGLFDTDGHVQTNTAKGGMAVTVSFTNTSGKLVRQLQYLLLHFGIIATVSSRQREAKNHRIYELLITGNDAKLFSERIGFSLKRKAEKLVAGLNQKKRSVSTGDIIPDALPLMIRVTEECKIQRGCRNKEFDRLSLASLKKKKSATANCVQNFLRKFAAYSSQELDSLKSLVDDNVYYDEISSVADGGVETYDIHVPEEHEYCANGFFSHNTKIRGQRANIIIADEFASISKEVFETVIRGFAAVSLSPVEQYREEMKKQAIKELGLWTEAHQALEEEALMSNQTILSGTAYYTFNHFYEYWKRYKAIVESRGDEKKVATIFNGEVPAEFNYRDYSVIRIPVQALPRKFMDMKQIAQAKATISKSSYELEYGAVFVGDSEGFFKRSLVESCVVGKPGKEISHPSCSSIRFHATLTGNPTRKHVIAIDPASESDNFAIIVLECWPEHRRIVHCWTTTRKRHKAKVAKGIAEDVGFYAYAARKVRELMVKYPCARIAIDSQGGGVSVMEELQDKSRLLPGERVLLPTIVEGEEKPTDAMAGDHIIEVINFSSSEWVSGANHGMKFDFESKSLLFPEFDPATIEQAFEQDKAAKRIQVDSEGVIEKLYDTLDDCVMEIEELKDELATIVHTETGTGRERWDTPEIKAAGSKKGRLRKDRYSALLMANMVARVLQMAKPQEDYATYGGFAHVLGGVQKEDNNLTEPLYVGPAWWTESGLNQDYGYGAVVQRA